MRHMNRMSRALFDIEPCVKRLQPPLWRMVLLACVLAGVSAWLAVHEVGHLSDGRNAHPCQICLFGGGLDQVAAPAPAALPFVAPLVPQLTIAASTCSALVIRRYLIRAPPLSQPLA
jgi:hypothetical protein